MTEDVAAIGLDEWTKWKQATTDLNQHCGHEL